jgi:uncharacterized protein
MKLSRLLKYYCLKCIRLRDDPKSLAAGTAIGVFVGLTPTLPFHTLALITLTTATRTSLITAVTTSWIVSNPLTFVPIYYFSLVVGNAVTRHEVNWEKIEELLQFLLSHPGLGPSLQALATLGLKAIIVMVVGGCIMAMPFTLLSYFLALFFFMKIRQKRTEKHIVN